MSPSSDSTLPSANSSTEQEPLLTVDDLWPEPSEELLARHEAIRKRCVQAFSSAPLYAARAAQDPEYWSQFSVGQAR